MAAHPNRKPKFLGNLKHFHGISSLNGKKPNVSDVTARLCSLRRSDVLAWLCSLSGFVSNPANNESGPQLQLSSELLPKELHLPYRQLVNTEQNAIGGPGGLFHLQQIWFMLQMALICCKEDTPVVSEHELRTSLAVTCLMANDIIQAIDSHVRCDRPEDDKFDEWCVGHFLPLSEVYSDDEVLPRAHLLWFECAQSPQVQKKASEQNIEPDIEIAFATRYGIPLREFFLFLVALRVHFEGCQISNPNKPHLLDSTEYLGRIFDRDFLTVALPLVSETPEALAIRLLASRQSWSNDIAPMRDNPLIQVFDGRFCCPDLFLLFRTLTEKVLVLLERAYPEGKFKSHFGYIFEQYLSRVIDEFVSTSSELAKVCYKSPKFEGTQQQAGDCILHLSNAAVGNDVAVVMEWKAIRLTNRQKYGGGTDELLQAIKDSLATDKKKGKMGAGQLASVLNQILAGKRVFDAGGPPIDLSSCSELYPVIVTSEETVGSNCVRRVVQKEFDQFLVHLGCDMRRIKPLMILTVRDFESLEAASRTHSVANLLRGFARYLQNQDTNPIGGFREYLSFLQIAAQPALSARIEIFQGYFDEITRRDEKASESEDIDDNSAE